MFLRPEAVAEWEQLNNFNKVLHVEGPPGTGKSTIAWAWACFKARDTNVVWVHRTAGGRSRISWLGAGYVVYFDFPARLESELGLVLSACALLGRATVVVVDGITNKRKDLFEDTAAWANASQHRQAVLVTSAQIVFPGQFNVDRNIARFSMPSWTFEQYEQACADAAFFEAVKRKLGWKPAGDRLDPQQAEPDYIADLLKNKFVVAGFSARWMFSLTSREVAAAILDFARGGRCHP